MCRDTRNLLEALRRGADPLGNALIDAVLAHRISRRALLRQASVIGLSAPVLGWGAARAAAPGGTIRVGHMAPQGSLEPVKSADPGAFTQLAICGEYLCTVGADFTLRPGLAESWSANPDGSIWTFKIRKGVTFHSGRPMTATDVVASFDRLSDPDNDSNALTAFNGVLSKGGARAVDDATVAFHLEAPLGQFPYLVSSDTPNAIILPADYRGDYEANHLATGPFKLELSTPGVGASFLRNTDYWGPRATPERLEVTFFSDEKALVDALLADQIDIMASLSTRAAAALVGNPTVDIISVPSSAHTQVHMRTDLDPFKDPRVRRAVALTLDRPGLTQGLFGGRARIGNDSPFAAIYPSTDTSVPQRARDLAQARQLLEAAGLTSGFSAELTSQTYQEIPDYALAIQHAVAEIGVKLTITALEPTSYFASGVFGKSPWLDCAMGITDYVHHAIPHAHLMAPLRSDGAWNAARYRNPVYDKHVASYSAAVDLDSQRRAAADIQKTLLDDTPVIFGYFTDALAAVRKGVTGVVFAPQGQVWLAGASFAR